MTTQGTRSYDRYKRIIDIIIAALGLALTAPIQVAVFLAIRRKMGSPAFFRQQRPGMADRPFTIIKFRTMDSETADTFGVETDRARTTELGSWLRSTSLDELPTLWNVLRGDMSLVGPRPLLMSYLKRYSSEELRRHEVRPGITGLAQIRGRNLLTWQQKFAADIEYVDRRSLRLDGQIIIKTIVAVLRREGINAGTETPMPEFMGRAAHRDFTCDPW